MFTTNTDTEVIVHLYEEYGTSFAEHLNGMFAIALWDASHQRLVLVRDRLGVKPLYYANSGNRLAFGSEIKCLLTMPELARHLDPQAVYNYFCLGYIPQPRSIYAAICKLPPAHLLVADKGEVQIKSYWTAPETTELMTDADEAKEQLRELLLDATRIRMNSDVPLGAFLSGGVDSSITVALMSQLSSRPVRTFFIDFDDSRYSERPFARSVAERYGTEHREFVVRPEAVSVLDDLVRFFDEPFGDSSAIPTYYLSQLTREHVTVALAGDGGDEAFGGYNRYRTILCRGDSTALRRVLRPLGNAIHGMLPRKARGRRYFRSLGMTNPEFFAAGTQELETRETLSASFLDSVARTLSAEIAPPARATIDPLAPYTRFDTQWYLPDDILAKVDRTSMAHSLEVRSPFLDYRLFELAARMPHEWKITRRDSKLLLKQAFAKDLPNIVLKPRKRGFSIPLADWLRSDLRPLLVEAVEDRALRESEIFDLQAIRGWIDEHMSGVRSRAPQLWRFLFFTRWWHAAHNQRVAA